MFHQSTSRRQDTPTRRPRINSHAASGAILMLVFMLLAACGRSTSATPPSTSAPHGLYVTSVHTQTSTTKGAGYDTVDVTSVGLTDGKLGWRVSSQWPPFLSPQTQATITGPLLLAPILNVGTGPTPTPTSSLIAYDRQTGRQMWSARDGAFVSAMSLSDGVVYTSSVQSTSAQTYQKVVTALRGSDGHTLWRLVVPAVNGFNDVITPVNGVLYIVSNQICFDYCSAAYLFAVRMSDGKLLWEHTLTGNFDLAAPTVERSMLYLNVPVDYPVSGASFELDAYHADTGALAWSFAPHLSQFEFYGAPFIADGTVYTGVTTPLASEPGRSDHSTYALVALDGQTGRPKWQVATNLYPAVDTSNAQTLFVEDQTAIQPSGNVGVSYLSAIRRSDGKRLWRVKLAGGLSSPQFVGGSIIGLLAVGGPTMSGEAVAFSAADGHLLWRTPLGVATPQITAYADYALGVLGATVYASYDGSTLYALRLSDGGVLWKQTLPDGIARLTVI